MHSRWRMAVEFWPRREAYTSDRLISDANESRQRTPTTQVRSVQTYTGKPSSATTLLRMVTLPLEPFTSIESLDEFKISCSSFGSIT